jgi:ADP-heptose:LPS heptosyltransferase
LHEVERQLQLLTALGIAAEDTSLAFRNDDQAQAGLREKLACRPASGQPLVLLCPFSQDAEKNWTIDGFAAVLRTLSEFAACMLIGTAGQLPGLKAVNAGAGGPATVLGGCLSIGELGALIKAADLLITVDTGPLHIAQAFQTPVVALMGPTDPKVWGPRRACDVVLYKPTPCSPCWRRADGVKDRCRVNECMRRILPEDVLRAVAGIIGAGDSGRQTGR